MSVGAASSRDWDFSATSLRDWKPLPLQIVDKLLSLNMQPFKY